MCRLGDNSANLLQYIFKKSLRMNKSSAWFVRMPWSLQKKNLDFRYYRLDFHWGILNMISARQRIIIFSWENSRGSPLLTNELWYLPGKSAIQGVSLLTKGSLIPMNFEPSKISNTTCTIVHFFQQYQAFNSISTNFTTRGRGGVLVLERTRKLIC